MKIDLLDIETQYINNRNLNYAKKHYIELKYGIIRLEITHIDKIDSTFIEMESIIAGYENETSLTINNEEIMSIVPVLVVSIILWNLVDMFGN